MSENSENKVKTADPQVQGFYPYPVPPEPPKRSAAPAVVIGLVIGVAIIISTAILTFGFLRARQGFDNAVSATGSASMDFDSDLIVWGGRYSRTATTSQLAYSQLEKDREAVKKYLTDNGIPETDFSFSSVSFYQTTQNIYDENGNFIRDEATGYELSQSVSVQSADIDTVEKVSRDISTLLASGIQFTSFDPEYYCTTLDQVKLDLIRMATENAKNRIDIIAEGTGAKLGKLKNSNLGVFQITARNSGTSDYTYDGYFDTSSREKTATITVNLRYELE